MGADRGDSPVSYLARGHFEKALLSLRASLATLPAAAHGHHYPMLAELLERTGRTGEAAKIVHAVISSSRFDGAAKARCFVVKGLLEKRNGRLRAAADSFRQACNLAEATDEVEALCWAQLRLASVLGALTGHGSIQELQPQLCDYVARLGSPQVFTAYHVIAAELEAKQGNLRLSQQHQDLADALLGALAGSQRKSPGPAPFAIPMPRIQIFSGSLGGLGIPAGKPWVAGCGFRRLRALVRRDVSGSTSLVKRDVAARCFQHRSR
jgi:tetratricopeptide (TPR) repeat protein